MGGSKPAKVEDKDHDEDKSEVLGNLVKVVVLIWSASLLTFRPTSDFQTVKKFLILTLPSLHQCSPSRWRAFGLSPATGGNGNGKTASKKQEDTAPPVQSAIEPKDKPKQ